MHDDTLESLHDAERPIISLISKSEKAQQKLTPGTWQHTMLRDNLKALRIGLALMTMKTEKVEFSAEDFREALRQYVVMITKTEKARVKFKAGTSQHTLLSNRLNALRSVETLVRQALDRG